MAAPMVNTAMASLITGAGARPFAACRPPMAAPTLPPRLRALVVRAQNKDDSDINLQDKLGSNLQDKWNNNMANKLGTDLQDKWNNNMANKLGTDLQERSGNFKDKSGIDRSVEVFKFWGPAPERINGRLAMLGFVSALVVEAYRGEGILSQARSATGMAWFAGTALLFTVASLVPLLSGQSPEDRNDNKMGIWTVDAEIINGRAAMVGLVALVVTEYLKGTPLINM